ncbi:hypothetical protein BaRGS_00016919, partial [Batillaria attramentaria]
TSRRWLYRRASPSSGARIVWTSNARRLIVHQVGRKGPVLSILERVFPRNNCSVVFTFTYRASSGVH